MRCWVQRFAMTRKEANLQVYNMAQWCYFTQDDHLGAFAVSLLRQAFAPALPDDVSLKAVLHHAKLCLTLANKIEETCCA